MGNQCAGARESLTEKKKTSSEYYGKMKESMKNKADAAKNKAKDKYSVARLLTKGYKINNFDDNGETKVITKFENSLPICKVALDEFETKLKGFQEKEKATVITLPQLIELFKDH